MKRNLILKVIGGQRVRLEDVTEYSFDAHGLNIVRQDVTKEKVGEEMKEVIQVIKMWFNPAGILDFSEEWVKA